MKALGMIELYGYLAAVEALDSALKAANVSSLGATKVGGGLVTVMVEGDVGAVKASMDAAASDQCSCDPETSRVSGRDAQAIDASCSGKISGV